MSRSSKENFRRLYEVAEAQDGFFTTKQAQAAGYPETAHPYHVKAGNWIREHRGIYRLAYFPLADRWDLILYSLWSRNRAGIPQGIYSHETALSIYDLSDANPAKIHVTAPKNFRRNSEIPGVLVLHRADLPKTDVERRRGFSVTRPLRTIVDLLIDYNMVDDIIQQAVREARARGLITYKEMREVKAPAHVKPMLDDLLRQVA